MLTHAQERARNAPEPVGGTGIPPQLSLSQGQPPSRWGQAAGLGVGIFVLILITYVLWEPMTEYTSEYPVYEPPNFQGLLWVILPLIVGTAVILGIVVVFFPKEPPGC